MKYDQDTVRHYSNTDYLSEFDRPYERTVGQQRVETGLKMEASFLPKMEGQGGKQNEHGHSLLFDSAMKDRVLRLNAYEDRLLSKRTEHIEKQKQQTLEEHNFCKSQFLLRFSPVVKRQEELKKDLMARVFDQSDARFEMFVERNRPSSSYPTIKSRSSTAASGIAKPSFRRTVSAALRFPALQESMDDVLNGYRTVKPQPKSVSPTKMRLRGNWDRELQSNDTPARKETIKESSVPKKKTSKGVDFCVHLTDEEVEDTNRITLASPKISNGKPGVKECFAEADDKNFTNSQLHFARPVEKGTIISSKSSKEIITDRMKTKSETKSKSGDSGVVTGDKSYSFLEQLKICQKENNIPERLIEDLIQALKSDTTTSSTARFLAKMLNTDGHKISPSMNENLGNLLSFRSDNDNGVHLLSDVKKRQRNETQRLRIMRTIVLAYDTVWNERVKKINSAA